MLDSIAATLVGRLLGISFRSLTELERWPLERNWAAFPRAELARHLTRYVLLPASRNCMPKFAEVYWEARRKGRPIETADAWIAASALHYQVPLITHNVGDYQIISHLQLLTADYSP